jgi:23S rRNA pseudouridine1911/1915/1917 synthase
MTSLAVLYEDGDMLVADKPAGVHTAPLRQGEGGTLLDAVIAAYPGVASVPGMKPVEPGLVHRLDRETSGCVVVARTPAAFATLRAIFDSGRASKHYRAACGCAQGARSTDPRAQPGAPEPDVLPGIGHDAVPEGTFRVESMFAPFGPGRRMVRVILPGEEGRPFARKATADAYRTDARIVVHGRGRVLVEAAISRGFRHQVRAHLAFLGFPIIGDPLYGVPVPEGFNGRMYLHAARILIPHPVTGETLIVESPEPPEFMALFGADSIDPDANGGGQA